MLKSSLIHLTAIYSLAVSLTLAAAQPDRLEQPSPISPAAHGVMLTDIARAGERLVAVGDFGVVLYSDDHGHQWQQANVPVTTLLTSLFFTSDQQGWMTGHDGVLLFTENAGQDWQLMFDGNQLNQLKVEFFEGALANLSDEALEEDPYLEEDLAFALEDAEMALEDGPVNPLLNVWFKNSQTGFLLGAYGLALRTDDAGQSWQFISHELPNPDQYHLNAITQLDDSLIIAGEAGLLMRSDDHGESWYELPSPYGGSFFDVIAHQGALYALGLRGHLFVSQDGGFDWQEIPVDTTVSFMGAYSDGDTLSIAGLGGTLLTGTDPAQLMEHPLGTRHHFNAVVATASGWVLAGEQGIFKAQQEGVSP